MLFDDGYAKIVKSSKMTKIAADPIKVQIEVMLLFLESPKEIPSVLLGPSDTFKLNLVSSRIISQLLPQLALRM